MGRPPQRLLSRDQIARTALELLDAEGPAGLGMRHLAQRLGVRAPSLYNHVSGQDEVIDLVHDLVDAEIDISTLADPDWRTGLEAFARSYRQAFLRHPHAVALVSRRPILSRATLNVYDAAAEALSGAGVPAGEVMRLIAVIDYLVLGSAIETFINGFSEPTTHYRADYPHLASALAATDRDTVVDDAFELAVQQVLDYIEWRLESARNVAPERRQRRPPAASAATAATAAGSTRSQMARSRARDG